MKKSQLTSGRVGWTSGIHFPNGPVLLPLGEISPKPSDMKILVGNILYVSKLQAKYIKKIDWPMVERYLSSSGESKT